MATGLNWYALGLKAALVGILVTATWMQATKVCETKHLQQQVDQAKEQVVEIKNRVPEVERQGQESARRQQRIEDSGRKLDEANKANPTGTCNFSDDQLRALRELADQTRK